MLTEAVFVGTVWPGDSVFPDFTLAKARDWWGGLYKDFVGMGVSGFWNDMNEPSVFLRDDKTMPLTNLHRLDDGTTRDHRAIHNVFGMENVARHVRWLAKTAAGRAAICADTRGLFRHAEIRSDVDRRQQQHLESFVDEHADAAEHGLVRLHAGGRRHRWICRNASGGFVDALDRAGRIQSDLSRSHRERHRRSGAVGARAGTGNDPQDAISSCVINCFPYIYTGTEEMTRTGLPFMRPIFLEYPQLNNGWKDDHNFLFGRDLFVAPVDTEMLDAKEVQLPPGDWYDFWSGNKVNGAKSMTLHPRLEELPLFVRGGAILPMQAVVQSTSETPAGGLKLRVYPGSDCGGALYMDDGHTYAYEKNQVLRVRYGCQVASNNVTVSSKIETNDYKPWWNSAEVILYGAAGAAREVKVGDLVIGDARYDPTMHTVTFTVPDAVRDWSATVSF